MADEAEVLQSYLAKNGLRMTAQRELVLKIFLRTERHVSAEDLYLLFVPLLHVYSEEKPRIPLN